MSHNRLFVLFWKNRLNYYLFYNKPTILLFPWYLGTVLFIKINVKVYISKTAPCFRHVTPVMWPETTWHVTLYSRKQLILLKKQCSWSELHYVSNNLLIRMVFERCIVLQRTTICRLHFDIRNKILVIVFKTYLINLSWRGQSTQNCLFCYGVKHEFSTCLSNKYAISQHRIQLMKYFLTFKNMFENQNTQRIRIYNHFLLRKL